MKTILTGLKKYGLNEKEAEIYITLLKVVEATVFQISKESNVPRTSTYTALEQLKKKGFVTSFRKNNVIYYTPENPKEFLRDLKEKEEVINSIIPGMNDLVDTTNILPVVKLYKGKKGYVQAREQMLDHLKNKTANEILAVTSTIDLLKFPKYFPEWIEKRKKMKVPVRMLAREDVRVAKYFQNNESVLRTVKYLPRNYQFDGTINIYGDKMAVFTFKNDELYSLIINSSVMVNIFKQFFNLTWDILS